MIVLDASVAIEWLFGPSAHSAPSSVHEMLFTSPVLVPSHWSLEISNTLRPDLRDNKLSVDDFHTIMERLDRLNLQVEAPIGVDEIGPLAHFAVAHNLTAYDAAYLQIALRQKATLATLDRAMRRAAVALNIPLLPSAAP